MDPLPAQQKVFRRDRSARKRRRSGGEQADSESNKTNNYLFLNVFYNNSSSLRFQVTVARW